MKLHPAGQKWDVYSHAIVRVWAGSVAAVGHLLVECQQEVGSVAQAGVGGASGEASGGGAASGEASGGGGASGKRRAAAGPRPARRRRPGLLPLRESARDPAIGIDPWWKAPDPRGRRARPPAARLRHPARHHRSPRPARVAPRPPAPPPGPRRWWPWRLGLGWGSPTAVTSGGGAPQAARARNVMAAKCLMRER